MKGGGRRNRQLTGSSGPVSVRDCWSWSARQFSLRQLAMTSSRLRTPTPTLFPVAPYFSFFAAIGVHSSLVAILISFAVIFAFPPAVYINLAMCQRAPFAWAWDGLAPQRLTKVSDKYHTPVTAIVVTFVLVIATTAWAAFSTSFATIFTIFTLCGFVTIGITGLAATTMAWRRPELYRGSAADWKVLGVPVLPVAGIGTIAFTALMVVEAIRFHTALGVSSLAELLGPPIGVIVVGAVYYLGARAFQKQPGNRPGPRLQDDSPRLMALLSRRRKQRGLRLFFCTDVHGSEQCFRKFLNAASFYSVDHLVLGGVLLGKLLIPIVQNGNGNYYCNYGDQPTTRTSTQPACRRSKARSVASGTIRSSVAPNCSKSSRMASTRACVSQDRL